MRIRVINVHWEIFSVCIRDFYGNMSIPSSVCSKFPGSSKYCPLYILIWQRVGNVRIRVDQAVEHFVLEIIINVHCIWCYQRCWIYIVYNAVRLIPLQTSFLFPQNCYTFLASFSRTPKMALLMLYAMKTCLYLCQRQVMMMIRYLSLELEGLDC